MSEFRVDPKKVNLAEEDIEEWLYQNPNALKLNGAFIDNWVGRQMKLPSGEADLIGVLHGSGWIVVVEVKNVELTPEALTQVCRYAADLERAQLEIARDYSKDIPIRRAVVFKGGVSEKLLYEAEALNVHLVSFVVNLSLALSGPWGFAPEHKAKIAAQYNALSQSALFKVREGDEGPVGHETEPKGSATDIIEAAREIVNQDHDEENG